MLIKIALFAAGSAALLAMTAETTEAAPLPPNKNPVVVIETSMGVIKVELFEDKAPVTVKNFLGYVDDKFYDGTIFHRVLDGFMVQGGGLEPGFKEKAAKKPAIQNEAANGVKNTKYTVAMARTGEPHTATAQFFINVADNDFLNHKSKDSGRTYGYATFGKVIDGEKVVDKIKAVKVARTAVSEGTPAEDVVIKSVRRAAEKDAAKPVTPEKK